MQKANGSLDLCSLEFLDVKIEMVVLVIKLRVTEQSF